MPRFRKKPVVIEAFQIGVDLVPDWASSDANFVEYVDGDGASIRTLEGVLQATPGDWIIKGVKGEIYPCKPDIFDMTYESAD